MYIMGSASLEVYRFQNSNSLLLHNGIQCDTFIRVLLKGILYYIAVEIDKIRGLHNVTH